MDAGNELGPDLHGARIRIGQGLGCLGGSGLWGVLLVDPLDAMWCGLGYALEGRGCGRWFARCVLRGRAAMDAGNRIRPEGAASLAPALEKMPQLTSLNLGGARIRIERGLGCLGGPGSLVLAVGYALGCDVVWFGVRA
jgi:hypothetical protein